MKTSSMTVAVIAEKPSVARDIAQVLGARDREDGGLRGGGYVVTWAIGHLVALAEPHQMNARWREWRLADLPMVPDDWPLVVSESTREQFDHVRRILNAPEVAEIVCATDAGREGELIFRYIYEAAGCRKVVRRLWISSLTPAAIAKGFRELRAGGDFDALARAAKARSRADWLVGMNLSRAYSTVRGDVLSVGRVQTPTLAMVVARELEIRAFVPEDYCEVAATFGLARASDGLRPESGVTQGTYTGVWFLGDRTRLDKSGEEAARIVTRVKSGQARIESVKREVKTLPPPLLYDLTELQRDANRLYGMSAQRTLDLAQALYERRKLLSYPRTDSRKLSRAVAETLPEVVRAVAGPYRADLAPGTGERPLGRRFVDDAEVTDHHAIIPTVTVPPAGLAEDERRIYDLVCRRLLSAWHDDYLFAVTKVVTAVTSTEVDRFASSGTSVERVGWKALEPGAGRKPLELPGGLTEGDTPDIVDAKTVKKQTRPPPHFTDASLLTAMETAGRQLGDREIADAMRECGLGTPATRAATIETLLKRAYVVRDGKSLAATDKGVSLIEVVHSEVKSAAMTGEWEAKLARIERGTGDFDAFMKAIEAYVRGVVANVAASGPAAPAARAAAPRVASNGGSTAAAPVAVSPVPQNRAAPQAPVDLAALLRDRFGFASFRPYQEEVCRAVVDGHNVLLVMPTGAGKSLCYQLPGLARGGTTLVVSPLIALMEDQVAKLTRHGISAERIHSGRGREASRAACRAYLDGRLDFLFIAPERLRVPGFPEMLARRPPTLVAVDEAHCISQWGHDFRPEYRMLGARLPLFRDAPVLAVTATATPAVQDDIVEQLRLASSERFIHGFRRTNIAVEAVEMMRRDRADAVASLLARAEHRPAIVYAPTRREAEALAERLSRRLRAEAYHAGLSSAERDRVQTAFVAGDAEIVVATTAFGMGIDKANVRLVVHTALPASLEGYYQEIGRAGRDGAPSRAVLFHSFVDGKTLEFFHGRDYPDVATLQAVFDRLGTSPVARDKLRYSSGLDPIVFENALEKLWLHGGARVDVEDAVSRGATGFAASYERQKAHGLEQIAKMRAYASKSGCRMLQLVRHFGDTRDSGAPCGQCDICAPDGCIAQSHREPSAAEKAVARRIVAALTQQNGKTVGQLHREISETEELDRRSLEHVLGGLVRARAVRLDDDSFVKDGTTIVFQRAHLVTGPAGHGEQPPGFRIAGVGDRPSRPRRSARKGTKGRAKRQDAARAPARSVGEGDGALFEALRNWRLGESRRTGMPAFRIFSDRTLLAIAADAPGDETALLRVSGVGPGLARRYGTAVLDIVARHARDAP
jgi:DNA topoisomerase-3